jgi:hypothetical protein
MAKWILVVKLKGPRFVLEARRAIARRQLKLIYKDEPTLLMDQGGGEAAR